MLRVHPTWSRKKSNGSQACIQVQGQAGKVVIVMEGGVRSLTSGAPLGVPARSHHGVIFPLLRFPDHPLPFTHKVNSLLDHIISSPLLDNIKILSGQLNPSSISDLIVMVLPGVPQRPPAAFAALYDT